MQRAGSNGALGLSVSVNVADVEMKTTVTTRFQLAMSSTPVSIGLPLNLDSVRPWWFTMTAKTPELALLKTSLNKVAGMSVSFTSSC